MSSIEPVLAVNRDRRQLLTAVGNGRVYRSMGGCDMWAVRRGQNQRVERRLRELVDAGWAELGTDGRTYRLTDAGTAAMAGGA
jgi:hypothetical protein